MKALITYVLLLSFCAVLVSQDLVLAQRGDKYSLAVLNLTTDSGNITRTDARIITGRLTSELARAGLFFTMGQSNMERGLFSKNIDPSLCGSIDCAIRAGRSLGVQLVVLGSIEEVEGGYRLDVQMVHVATRDVVKSHRDAILGGMSELYAAMPAFARTFLGQKVATKAPAKTSPAPRPVEESTEYSTGSSFKWYYAGLGLVVAGGIGAGVFLLKKGSSDGTTPPGQTGEDLPGPPTFP